MAQGREQLTEVRLEVPTATELRRQIVQSQTSAVFSFANSFRKQGLVSTSRVEMADSPGIRPKDKRKRVNYENTYKMTPDRPFPYVEVRRIISDVINSHLKDEKYDQNSCRQHTKTLAEMIKMRVKELSIPRYKIVCLVHIGQINGQTVRVASQCLWNPEFDTFAEYSFKNGSLFATGQVYGVYYE